MLVEPKGARANSWEDVADLSDRSGIVLDDWQELILRVALGERADATWAAKRVGVSVPRQNGKSQLLVARALAGALLFGEKKIVISAHQADTARETFGKFMEIHDDDANQWLRDRVKPNGIMYAINRESIKFRNGAVIQFKARTGSGGRGFSSDCLMLDEAQRLKRAAWVSINSTMSAMHNPQVWLLGTPPTREDYDAGMGEVFESIRSAAIDGVSTAAAWAEWGADPKADGFDPAAEFTRWRANPAWNSRINHEIVQGEFESYTPEEFGQDRLGIWLADLGGGGTRAISVQKWSETAVDGPPEGVKSFGVAFSVDGSRVGVAGAVAHGNDETHVELIDATAEHGGLAPLADWLCEKDADGKPRWRRAGGDIVIGGAAGAGVLKQLLLERRVSAKRIRVVSTPQYLQACAMFADAIEGGTATHLRVGQQVLDDSVAVTDKDKRGGWMATTPDGDETPVEAVSLALWGARTSKRTIRTDDKERGIIL